MVSFQCNGCGDVLTKPKLDKHRAMCHASFDCIDCSKRFETPADYKGHTSCISEAEKHQKTLYNVGKEGGPERNGRNQRLRQQGGGRQWGNNQPRWQQRNMNQATGANDTPLGTPVRMSPETTEASVVVVESGTKHKSTSKVAINERPPQNPDFRPVEDGRTLKEEQKKKKRLEAKGVKEDEKEAKKKQKQKKTEKPSSSGREPNSGAMLDAKTAVTVQLPVTEVPSANDTGEARSTKKKSKSREHKSKLKTSPTVEASDVPAPAKEPQPAAVEVAGVARDDQRDWERRRQSGDHHEDSGDGKRVAEGSDGSLKEKRKEKKRKRKP